MIAVCGGASGAFSKQVGQKVFNSSGFWLASIFVHQLNKTEDQVDVRCQEFGSMNNSRATDFSSLDSVRLIFDAGNPFIKFA